MLTYQHVEHWQKTTQTWLTQAPEALTVEQLAELRQVLQFHEYRYYVLAEPLITDFEYDQLFKLLEATEKAHPEWVTPDSPTQRVGNSLTDGFKTVEHLIPMLSLENSYNATDLLDWDRKAKEAAGTAMLQYCVEPKYDGASISVIYENNQLVRAATRGDGVKGDDITNNAKKIRNLPLWAPLRGVGIETLEIRGEILMTKNAFASYNAMLAEQGLPPLANPRNAAAGSLRLKDSGEVGRRNLEAFLYHVSYLQSTPTQNANLPHTHFGMLQLLKDAGFNSPAGQAKKFDSIQGVIEYCNEFETVRDTLPYEIDGLVIKVNDLELQEKMGMTSHHPRWAIAYKFKARQAESVLREVQFQVGRTGAITPVAKIDPAPVGGVVVSSITLHNEDFIKEKGLMLGDPVIIERAGDVIPQIVRVVTEKRNGSETPIVFPTNCPTCQSELFKEDGEAVWRCVNADCPSQVVERIIHFVSKDAMDIRSFGEQQVRRFYDLGLLKDIQGLYRLDFSQIGKLEGFGPRSVQNLQQSLEQSKNQPLHRLLYALGIRHVGETMAKTLARRVQHIMDFEKLTEADLLQLEDVGPKVAASIQHFFHNPHNLHMLHELELLGVTLCQTTMAPTLGDLPLAGKTFLFTGALTLKRSEAEALVEKVGGSLLGGVSSKLNYLVVGEDAGSKLEKAKKITSITILNEQQFLEMVGG